MRILSRLIPSLTWTLAVSCLLGRLAAPVAVKAQVNSEPSEPDRQGEEAQPDAPSPPEEPPDEPPDEAPADAASPPEETPDDPPDEAPAAGAGSTDGADAASPAQGTPPAAGAIPEAPAPEPATVQVEASATPAGGQAAASADSGSTDDQAKASDGDAGEPPKGAADGASDGDTEDAANLAAQGVLGAGGGGRLVYRVTLPWGHRVTGATLNASDQQSYNPVYSWSLSPNIIYFADPTTWFFAAWGAEIELTDSELTTRSQELLLGDLSIGTRKQVAALAPADGHNVLLWLGAGAAFPTSKASQAATRIVSLNANASASWIISDVMQALVIQPSTRFTVNADQQSTGSLLDAAYVCTRVNGISDTECTEGLDPNAFWSWNLGLGAQLIATGNLFLSLSAGWTTTRRHLFSATSIPLASSDRSDPSRGAAEVGAGGEAYTNTVSLGASATWLPLSMLGLTLSVTNAFAVRGPDSQLRSPFDANDIFLDFTISLFLDGTEAADDES